MVALAALLSPRGWLQKAHMREAIHYAIHQVKEFFLFRGRLRRRAFWGRVGSIYLVAFGAYAGLCRLVLQRAANADLAELTSILLLLAATYLVITQTVKRLHDTGLSGWWWWLLLVPVVGNVFGLGVPLVEGTSGPNRFGPDPKDRPGLAAPQPLSPAPLPAAGA